MFSNLMKVFSKGDKTIAFIDLETDVDGHRALDYGAVCAGELHTSDYHKFIEFIANSKYLCGHNIVFHDSKYITPMFQDLDNQKLLIDTLCLSALLFPSKPYHKLVKDDKLQSGELNNPLADARCVMRLFEEEKAAFFSLSDDMRAIFYLLLKNVAGFDGFFKSQSIEYALDIESVEDRIARVFKNRICKNAMEHSLVQEHPVELAYCLSFLNAKDKASLIPFWVLNCYPDVRAVMHQLRSQRCGDVECEYCRSELNSRAKLKQYFGYDEFRKFDNENLQEEAVEAAVSGQSLLCIFPTGGGKSLTFQLPAVIDYEATRSLTVVISPLQSLMMDQVHNLEKVGIRGAVTINGQLDPLERKDAIKAINDGTAWILYIAPESLRSKTIERLLLSRDISRFVIDEAHCFSAWGQDFRVDYMYIARFIRLLQEKKHCKIPVSCFTATAKQKVVSDICDYFNGELNLNLQMFATHATRTNLHYHILFKENEVQKYEELRHILSSCSCPSIVYVSRTKKAEELSERLCSDGFEARPYHGKMKSDEKFQNQDDFMSDNVRIIVATSAFGMGVDKDDVGLVVHYDIAGSLEDYVQEAGRAGRNGNIEADCYILFNNYDLDQHFSLLRRSRLSMGEIQQIWTAVKRLSKGRDHFCKSALEIAREAGWEEEFAEVETKVKTALYVLEHAGYIERQNNVPHVYADGICAKNMQEASIKIDRITYFSDEWQRTDAKRIVQYLIGKKSRSRAGNSETESRIDYIADNLGLDTEYVAKLVMILRHGGLLSDVQDLIAYIPNKNFGHIRTTLRKYEQLENFLADMFVKNSVWNYKTLNTKALEVGIKESTVKDIEKIRNYWVKKKYIEVQNKGSKYFEIAQTVGQLKLKELLETQHTRCMAVAKYLFSNLQDGQAVFSLKSLIDAIKRETLFNKNISPESMRDAVQYLNSIGVMDIEGGFLVLYSALQIKRLEMNNKIKYKKEDYESFETFYRQKVQQVHIIGKYANMLARNYDEAMSFISDYFLLDYRAFMIKYYRNEVINRAITQEMYEKLFDGLSKMQKDIIDDAESQYISVVAGPGSGKTKVLVHKLASLLILENVKADKLLMLTFSRSAATEFKERLIALIGPEAYGVEISTFHSYAFNLLGRVGDLPQADTVVRDAVTAIQNGQVQESQIVKTVLVIDEAQDMDKDEYDLVTALVSKNEDMRVIAVGDDDQNIYEFRGSNSKFMIMIGHDMRRYELIENYRSDRNIVEYTNQFVAVIKERMKTKPIISMKDDDGKVEIVKYQPNSLGYALNNHCLESSVCGQLFKNYHGGSCAVLTQTNEQALYVLGILTQHGYKARFIQSNDEFQLRHLYELHEFEQLLGNGDKSYITLEEWNEAVVELTSRCSESERLSDVLNILNAFSRTTKDIYYSDFEQFLNESRYEDFVDGGNATICVSTIHKAKGREFDSVYMLVSNTEKLQDKDCRPLYVGMTRAKHYLFIGCYGALFDDVGKDYCTYMSTDSCGDSVNEIIVQVGFKGVHLDWYIGKDSHSATLLSGSIVKPDVDIRLSKREKVLVEQYLRQGYKIEHYKVRFQVVWHKQSTETTALVLLPDIYLKRVDSLKDSKVSH